MNGARPAGVGTRPVVAAADRPGHGVRWVRWVTVTVVVVEVVLLAVGRLGLGAAISVFIAVEVVLGAAVLTVAWRMARAVDGHRVTTVIRTLLPGPVAAFATLEVGQARSLWLAVRGRVHTERPDDVTIPYAAGWGAVYGMVIAACLIEIVAVHLAVPWHRLGTWAWLQWLVLILSAYGAVWVLAWWAGQRTHPHLVTDGELVLRNATIVALRVPLEHIAAVTQRRRGQPADDRLVLGGLGGDTNLDVDLAVPVMWHSLTGRRSREVVGLSLAVDDPALASSQLRAAQRS